MRTEWRAECKSPPPATWGCHLPPEVGEDWVDDRVRMADFPNLNLITRTWVPMAETRDLKICPPANHPVSGLPLLDNLPSHSPPAAYTCLG